MKFIIRSIFRIGITILLTLIILIGVKKDGNFKEKLYQLVYEDNFDFAYINNIYNKYFGNVIPFKPLKLEQPVFNESLVYNSLTPYKDGVMLEVTDDYLVPVNEAGLVVFVGEKEGYGNVVVVEQVDGIDCWYGNLDTINVKLYDYVEEGSLLGSTSYYLYLLYKKDGEVISYEPYLS